MNDLLVGSSCVFFCELSVQVFGQNFLIAFFAFLLLICKSFLYIMDINSLPDICAMNFETNFWPLEITENLATVVVSMHNWNKNNGMYAKI